MIICFNCTPETRDELDRLVALGSYRDHSEAIAAAVRNQLLMEQEVGGNGAILIKEISNASNRGPADQDLRRPAKGNTASASASDQREKNSSRSSPTEAPAQLKRLVPEIIPALFRKEDFPQDAPAGLAELPTDVWGPGQEIPLDRWVLGQQNRLLPAKANSRALIRLFLNSPKGLPISPTAEQIAAEAAALGDYLSALDDARKTARDDALATAFPTTAEDANKGRVRYANQFVVYQNSRGELSGLMIDLKMINILFHRRERFIVPTHFAWEFAKVHNPVLDGAGDGAMHKFSPEERSLLIQHIVGSVPVEAFAYRVILEAVIAGNNTPDTIDAALKSLVTEDRVEKLSQSFLASQRSGAVSRMSDLGLIERQRDGVRVSYAVTEEGLGFLHACGSPTRGNS